ASRKSAETSGHALRRTTEDENWGCANWRPKDARLPWRPQLEREDFRGSLGAADTSEKRFLTETSLAQLTTAQQLVSWLVESVRATTGLQMNNPAPALTGEEFARRFVEINPPFEPRAAVVEANRCLYCFDAPCAVACPTHIDVPRFIKKIASGNLRGSAHAILDANILALSCSRVCPVDVLCEGACVMNKYNQQPIEIGRLQRHA